MRLFKKEENKYKCIVIYCPLILEWSENRVYFSCCVRLEALDGDGLRWILRSQRNEVIRGVVIARQHNINAEPLNNLIRGNP